MSRRLLGIAPQETSFARRGFRCDAADLRARLEEVGRTFVAGYHAALEESEAAPLAARLDRVDRELRGWAYEGAAMALAILDAMTPWRRRSARLPRFLAGPADPHVYLAHVGAGWSLARVPLSPARLRARLDPLLGWLALDGYGFHQGFFHWPQAIGRQRVPRRLAGYARRAFDQGLGRSLWFVEGADPGRIAAAVAAFPPARRGDLWSGVGLAAAYAGGVDRSGLAALRAAAAGWAPQLAQGAAFAAKARQRAGALTPATELACAVLCGCSAAAAAAATDEAQRELAPESTPSAASALPAYEVWRQRIAARFAGEAT
ncbi:MAG TPA: DUF1702 family protein [Thermoanaerobaculia bacterium]